MSVKYYIEYNLRDFMSKNDMYCVLIFSTISFTLCFATWIIFSIIALIIRNEINLSNNELTVLVTLPILVGSSIRIFIGILSDIYDNKNIFITLMIISILSLLILSYSNNYYQYLFSAFGIGLSGATFTVGISYVSKWFPPNKQGSALGIFGMGNIGASITHIFSPYLLFLGWESVVRIYFIVLFINLIFFIFFTKNDYIYQYNIKFNLINTKRTNFDLLKKFQVWRFSLYYLFVFGGFIALSLWLPRYYMGVYGLGIKQAGILTMLYSLPGSIFRAFGGIMSDIYGARKIMYIVFYFSIILLIFLSYPATVYIVQGIFNDVVINTMINLFFFSVFTILLGFFMSLGKGAVYKYISYYYPYNIGFVGGIVGAIGSFGGFFLPILFGNLCIWVGLWTSSFMLLLLISTFSLIWMYFSIKIK